MSTPAVRAGVQAGVPHQVLEDRHDPAAEAYGLEAAEALGLAPETVFKTLLATVDGKPQVALVPVTAQLSLKALARAAGGKKAEMAKPDQAQRLTGYVVGGISPLAQKRRLPTWIDISGQELTWIHVSAGRRGLELALSPVALAELCQARFVPLLG
ncbi:MAG: Cys-tRNA(Pro) deacylase [Ectothiorhodospiraceae bacterium]|nr:Cys-tRNA(Pro) deacylase [Ectothiorhodospiraceae bacterium]